MLTEIRMINAGNSMFLGIRVTMPCDEHKLPRFHADDNGQKVPADMMAGRVLKDAFPSRQLKFVLAWNEIMNPSISLEFERKQRRSRLH